MASMIFYYNVDSYLPTLNDECLMVFFGLEVFDLKSRRFTYQEPLYSYFNLTNLSRAAHLNHSNFDDAHEALFRHIVSTLVGINGEQSPALWTYLRGGGL